MIARLIIAPDIKKAKEEIKKHLSQFKVPAPHPDLFYLDSNSRLGIEQARKIKEILAIKPLLMPGKVVVLEDASKLTDEAQNSLLKTLEELPEKALFILAASSEANFLPTILSRCRIIKLRRPPTPEVQIQSTPEVGKLIEMGIAGRFKYIEKLKDRQQLLIDLTAFFRNKMVKDPGNKHISEFVKKLLKAQEWAAQNVNIRAILEYLMLVMPPHK